MGLGTRIVCVLTSLLIVGAASHAQDTIIVSGSSIVNALVERIADSQGAALDISAVGSARAIAPFAPAKPTWRHPPAK